MLKWIGNGIKFLLFAFVVLVAGNWIHWHGRTVSDQVKTTMAHATHGQEAGIFASSFEQFKDWINSIHSDSKQGQENLTDSDRKQLEQVTSSGLHPVKSRKRDH